MIKKKKRNGRAPLGDRISKAPPDTLPDFDEDEVTDAYGIVVDNLKKTTQEWVSKAHEALERLEKAEQDP